MGCWDNAEFVLRQIMDGITKVIAEVGGYKEVGKRQQRWKRSGENGGKD